MQFSLWKEAVPRRPAREACTRGQGWRMRGLGIPAALTLRPGAGGLAQEGMFRMVQGTQVEQGKDGGRWAGSMAGPCHRVDSRDESRISS